MMPSGISLSGLVSKAHVYIQTGQTANPTAASKAPIKPSLNEEMQRAPQASVERVEFSSDL